MCNYNRNKHFGSIITAINNIIKQVTEQVNELSKQYNAIISKLTEAIKETYPQIKESYNKIFGACMNVLDATANLAITYLKAVFNIINNHQKEIKELAVIGTGLVEDITKIIFKAVDQITKEVNEFITLLIDQAKALPVYEILKEKYNEIVNFEVPEALTSPVEELCKITKTMLPTKELQDFFGSACDYIMMIIKRQKVRNVVIRFLTKS